MPDIVSNNDNKSTIKSNPDVNYFAATNFRNQARKFGIKIDDRRRHMYVVGKTGMGKTTMLENMVLHDIYSGHGVGIIDPHGDFAEKIIDFIPDNRINDVVYFNPSDVNYPIGFNILESINPEHKHLVAAGLMGVFKKIWIDMWSSRMEYILNNTLLALLDFPDTTLLGINRMLSDKEYRNMVVKNLKDPVVKSFWVDEFASYNDRYQQEAVAPIQNKIGQFLSSTVIRNIVAQVKSRINIREIMDSRKIFIMNLSKGRVGEDNSRLLGAMLITKIQLSAMERVDTPEPDRKDFFLYVDEFQNFATESFSNILSEARKYRLDLIMAHQYMEQLDESVLAAVIGNVGSMITYRIGSTDAAVLVKEFAPIFTEEDLVNLPKFNVYLKLMIDGVSSRPFSAITLPPIGSTTHSAEKVVRASRQRHGIPREQIEEDIMRWSESSRDSKVSKKPFDNKKNKFKQPVRPEERPKKLGDFVDKKSYNSFNQNSTNKYHKENKPTDKAIPSRVAYQANRPIEKTSTNRVAPRSISDILSVEKNNAVVTTPVISLASLSKNKDRVNKNENVIKARLVPENKSNNTSAPKFNNNVHAKTDDLAKLDYSKKEKQENKDISNVFLNALSVDRKEDDK